MLLLLSLFVYSASSHAARNKKQQSSERQYDIQTLLYLAGTEPPPFTYRNRIQAAQLLEIQQRFWQARRVLEDIVADQLADSEYQEYVPLYVRLLLKTESAKQALELLYQGRLSRMLAQIPPELRLPIYKMRILTQLRNNRPMLAFRESIRVSALLNEDTRLKNNQVIWEILMNVPLSTLNNQNQDKDSSDLATRIATGWLQLAQLSRNYEEGALTRHRAMNNWLQLWSEHPATLNLPAEARLLAIEPNKLPRRIALLLPLSGQYAEAGKALRDGFLTAWYESFKRKDVLSQISVLDTGAGNIPELYRQAVSAGAHLVIGPLQRENVQALQKIRISIPILSLNYLPSNRRAPRLRQFGLSPDDELVQLAAYGKQQQWHDVLLVRPQGDWSNEYAQNFTNIWKTEDTYQIYEYSYINERDISIVVEQALSLDKSEKRRNDLKRLLQHAVKSAPRRRQDIDWVLFLGGAQQARLLTPVLRYHNAYSIPLLSTSRAFDGNPNKSENTDINSIVFTESPWLLEPSKLRSKLINDLEQERRIARLYGLGTDAWRILPWLSELEDNSDLRLYAASGRLSMQNRRIKRVLLWATINDGQIEQVLGADALYHLTQF